MIQLIVILLVLILLINFTVSSKFIQLEYKCPENKRLFPEGNIPGEYLGINKYTEDELTRKFNQNGDELITKYIDYKVSS
jgi:hypothetical protein